MAPVTHLQACACVCTLLGWTRSLWRKEGVGWSHHYVCVRSCYVCTFLVCVHVGGQWSVRACMCVSGGQGDKGACSSLIRTPTSTSLSLYCSTALLSILLPSFFCSSTCRDTTLSDSLRVPHATHLPISIQLPHANISNLMENISFFRVG